MASPSSGTSYLTPKNQVWCPRNCPELCLLPRVGEYQLGLDQILVLRRMGAEAELVQDPQHATALRQDFGSDIAQLLIAADGDELMEDLGTQSTLLELVADQEGDFGLSGAILAAQVPHGDDLAFPGLRVLVVGHQRDLAVVVNEADPDHPLVGDAPAQLRGVKVAQVEGDFGQLLVEPHQQRLVLGPD